MLLLVTKSLPEIQRIGDPGLGMLVHPRGGGNPRACNAAGVPWAADNDAYSGLDIGAYLKMLGNLTGVPGGLFVTAPDVVADWRATLEMWTVWAPVIRACGLPAAIVLQDGCDHVPLDAEAVFVGGSTEWKLAQPARGLVDEAKRRGIWTHMGRVNSNRRLELAASWGIDSVDGSGWAKWFDTHIQRGLTWAGSTQEAFA